MRAGSLRHTVTFERPVETRTAMGGVNKTWEAFKAVRAQLDYSGSKKVIAAQQKNSQILGVAVIRYTDGITADMRMRVGSEVFDIERPINQYGKNRELHIPFMSYV